MPILAIITDRTGSPRVLTQPDTTETTPPTPENHVALLSSLMDSRERWRGIAQSALDIVFETDRAGRLILITPDEWQGRNLRALIGQPASTLWQSPAPEAIPTSTQRRVLTINGLGGPCLLTYGPSHTHDRTLSGGRGSITSLPDTEPTSPLPATKLDTSNTAHLLDEIIDRLRSAIMPRIGIAAAFEALCIRMGAVGGVLLSNGPFSPALPTSTNGALLVVQRHGHESPTAAQVMEDIRNAADTRTRRLQKDGLEFLLCQERARLFGEIGVMLWRPMSVPWQPQDGTLAHTTTAMFAALLELDGIHRNVLKDAHFDPATNLLTWTGFRFEISRRLQRLDQEQLSATLMLVAIEGLTELTSTSSFEIGEEALRQSIELVRNAVRPADMIARISNDTFALWLDGGDRFAASERADRLCNHGAPIILNPPRHLQIKVGLVTREPHATDTLETYFERASMALRIARNGSTQPWQFSYEAP